MDTMEHAHTCWRREPRTHAASQVQGARGYRHGRESWGSTWKASLAHQATCKSRKAYAMLRRMPRSAKSLRKDTRKHRWQCGSASQSANEHVRAGLDRLLKREGLRELPRRGTIVAEKANDEDAQAFPCGGVAHKLQLSTYAKYVLHPRSELRSP